jgi:hypothetical protein
LQELEFNCKVSLLELTRQFQPPVTTSIRSIIYQKSNIHKQFNELEIFWL